MAYLKIIKRPNTSSTTYTLIEVKELVETTIVCTSSYEKFLKVLLRCLEDGGVVSK